MVPEDESDISVAVSDGHPDICLRLPFQRLGRTQVGAVPNGKLFQLSKRHVELGIIEAAFNVKILRHVWSGQERPQRCLRRLQSKGGIQNVSVELKFLALHS